MTNYARPNLNFRYLKFGDDNMPNYESVKSRVKMMNMPEDVKTDLHKGIEYCSKITVNIILFK